MILVCKEMDNAEHTISIDLFSLYILKKQANKKRFIRLSNNKLFNTLQMTTCHHISKVTTKNIIGLSSDIVKIPNQNK